MENEPITSDDFTFDPETEIVPTGDYTSLVASLGDVLLDLDDGKPNGRFVLVTRVTRTDGQPSYQGSIWNADGNYHGQLLAIDSEITDAGRAVIKLSQDAAERFRNYIDR